MNDTLPTEAAMGHQMMTAGLNPQYYWCDLCCAYTGYRARKLTKQCDRTVRKVPHVDALRQGRHLVDGIDLLTDPRPLCKRHAGSYGWNGEGRPDDCLELVTQHTVHNLPFAIEHSELALSALHAEEEDPLALGFDLD